MSRILNDAGQIIDREVCKRYERICEPRAGLRSRSEGVRAAEAYLMLVLRYETRGLWDYAGCRPMTEGKQ